MQCADDLNPGTPSSLSSTCLSHSRGKNEGLVYLSNPFLGETFADAQDDKFTPSKATAAVHRPVCPAPQQCELFDANTFNINLVLEGEHPLC